MIWFSDHLEFLKFLKSNVGKNINLAASKEKEGDDKKKEKSLMIWHGITCDGSVKKKDSKVLVYNQLRLRRSGRTCDFGPQPKAGAPWTVAGNPIDLCDEEDE